MAEFRGEGIPLGFIYTLSTDGTATTGAKGRILNDFLSYFAKQCKKVRFTLTDKERAEIDACRRAFPAAKHQCCYWHAIRYIEQRLSEDRGTLPYDPKQANCVFSFISVDWARKGDVGSKELALLDLESGGIHPRTRKEEAEMVEEERKV